jgi:hypothetical protein
MEKTKEQKLQDYKDTLVKSSKASDRQYINEEDKEEFRTILREKARVLHDLRQEVKRLEAEYHELTEEFIDKWISEWDMTLPESCK